MGTRASASRSGHAQIPLDDFVDDDGEIDREAAWAAEYAGHVFQVIDVDCDGSISKLELLAAMARHRTVDDFVLPGFDCGSALTDESSFEAVSAIFDAIGGGKARINRKEFVEYFRLKAEASRSRGADAKEDLGSIYKLIDADGRGTFSNFELLGAMQRFAKVADLLLPGIDRRSILRDETSFDAANGVWDAMSHGNRRIGFTEFAAYFSEAKPRGTPDAQRRKPRMGRVSKISHKHSAQKDGDKESDSPALKSGLQRDDVLQPTLLQSLRVWAGDACGILVVAAPEPTPHRSRAVAGQ